MTHARETIHSAVMTAVDTVPNLTVLDGGRVRPFPTTSLPAALVSLNEETSQVEAFGTIGSGLVMKRTGTVSVLLITYSANEGDLDDFAELIEIALATDPTLGGAVKVIQHSRASPRVSPGGVFASLELLFTFDYYSASTSPGQAL